MTRGIYKNPKEATRKRIETRRRNGWNKNPEDTKIKKKIAMTGKHWKIKDTSKMSEVKKGHKVSEGTRKKIGLANSIKLKGNKNAQGYKHTDEEIKKMKEARTGQIGENSSNWQGGISYESYSDDWTATLRESIRQRDNYICQLCGIHQDELEGFYRKLDIHHIDYGKDNLNPDNLITLCRPCHCKTNFNREYWKEYLLNNL